MATQTGSIDLEATNAAKLYAEAGFTNAAQTYATKSELTVSANQIRGEVAETYATKDEAALELSGSGTVVVLDEAADARLKALTIHGLSVQDGTPSPSAPVAIQSVQPANKLDTAGTFTKATTTYSGCKITNNGDGTYTVEGENTSGGWYFNSSSGSVALPAGTYTVCGGSELTGCTLYVYVGGSRRPSGSTFTLGSTENITKWAIYVNDYATISGTAAPALVTGDEVRPFVPYGSIAVVGDSATPSATPIPVTLRSLPDGTHDEWISGETADTLVQRVGETMQAVTDGVTGTVGVDVLSSTGEIANGAQVLYKLATPVTTTLPHVNLPYVHDGDSVWVDAQVTPNIDVAYWSENGETVSALSSTLTQTAAGLELQLQGKVDSSEEWVSWMHAGTDATTHEPYLAMGQDSDYPSVVYGSDAARFYDGEGDAASNVVASFGADGAVVGKTGAAHFEQTSSASKWYGSDGTTQLAEITTENNYPMFWLKDSMRRVIAGQMTYLGISDTEYSDYINMESYGVSNNHDAEVNLIASGTSGTAKFKVADTVPIATESTPANMLLTPSVLKLSVGYEQEGGTATLDATAKAAWLAALGLDVQSSNMTFASGLNSSYGSAPVRKCGAMGILKLNSVRLASQLASGGSVVIGTLPTGYIPQGSVDMHINIESNSSNYRNNYIIIEYSGSTNPGRVTLYNRSGYAIPNTVTFSCTCPFFI